MRHRTLLALATVCVLPLYADQPAPTPAAAHYEVKFMTDMIDHHAMAVMMADMCLAKAVHPELKSLCENIKATQTQEIATMQSWLQQWYEISYSPEMHMTGEMKRLMSLSGELFEIEFMQMMIRHHFKAVVESRTCQKRAYHPELVRCARRSRWPRRRRSKRCRPGSARGTASATGDRNRSDTLGLQACGRPAGLQAPLPPFPPLQTPPSASSGLLKLIPPHRCKVSRTFPSAPVNGAE